MKQSVTPRLVFIEVPVSHPPAEFRFAVVDGLMSSPKTLPCRLFYDQHGSEIFERICDLPEYYLTRTEQAILLQHAAEITAAAGERLALVEFGSGNSCKTRLLIEALLARTPTLHYFPIDISCQFLQASAHNLLALYPELHISAIAGEYRDGMAALPDAAAAISEPRLFLFLGSNIGNFAADEAIDFLARIRSIMSPLDRILIGVDLLKRLDTIRAAYNDSQGVTAEFNKNLLRRINAELDADFDLDAFEHHAPFVEAHGRIEMHLVSRRRQTVSVKTAGIQVEFEAGETIHTENSHKYSLAQIQSLASAADLQIAGSWSDAREMFALLLLEPTATS